MAKTNTSTTKNKSVAGGKNNKNKSPWQGIRPILGTVFIVLLMGFEYLLISTGFKQPNPTDTTPNGWGWGWPIIILVPMAGVMAFFGVMLISNIFSKDPDLSHGELRKAITAGIVVTYIFFIITTLFSDSSPVYKLVTQSTQNSVEEPQSNLQNNTDLELNEIQPAPTQEDLSSETSDDDTVTDNSPADDNAVQPENDSSDLSNQENIDTPLELAASIVNAFTTLVGVVVGFYFTSRSFDSYTEKKLIAQNPELAKIFNNQEE